MSTGVNLHHPCGDSDFHIQIEDLAESRDLDARVYVSGRVVFHKRVSYRDAVLGLENPKHIEVAVQDELAKLLALLKAAIDRGKITA